MTTCPNCHGPKDQRFYLCGDCWSCLPTLTKRALYRRDAKARDRLGELYRQIQEGVPLTEIEVTP